MDVEHDLRELELELLQTETRRNAALVASLLADDFREVGTSGRVFSRREILEALSSEAPADFSVSDFQAQLLAAGVALLTYRALRHDPSQQAQVASLRSSLWVLREGRWRMVFHQGTPVVIDDDRELTRDRPGKG